jgi:hypothetical protein
MVNQARVREGERPCPRKISVSDARNEVNIQGRLRSGTAVVFTMLGFAVIAGLLFVTVSPRAEANPHHSVLVLLSAGLFLGLAAAAAVARRERLEMGDNQIIHEKSLAGVRWARRQIDRGSVDAVRVQARGAGGHGLAIIGPQGRLLVGGTLEEADLEWLRLWVSSQLKQTHSAI